MTRIGSIFQKQLSPESDATFNLWSVQLNGGDEDAEAGGGSGLQLGGVPDLRAALLYFPPQEQLYFPLTS